MEKTWVLIANSERARCFERQPADHTLNELSDFVHPPETLANKASGGDITGAAGKGHGRTGHAGTQFEPRTEARAKERGRFAQELADFLNVGVAERRCHRIVVIASSKMLGELRPCLSAAADKALNRSIVGDLTRYIGLELKERVAHALELPD
jgi:protein required for attachment to host cells